jgi:hypothetical protein
VSGLVLTVHATCANVVGKVTIGLDVPPPPTILVGKELRPAATACRRFRTHNKIISECDVSSWRAGVLPAIPAGGAFASVVGHLNYAHRLPMCRELVSWRPQLKQSVQRR